MAWNRMRLVVAGWMALCALLLGSTAAQAGESGELATGGYHSCALAPDGTGAAGATTATANSATTRPRSAARQWRSAA